ncbi:O-antigen ligase family protein [Coraliomargarita sp. W4R53]
MREWLVALTGGLTLAFTAWGLGGVQAWSLHVMLVGGVLTLLLALGPWPSAGQAADHSGSASRSIVHSLVNVAAIQRLLRWPFFWLSGLFLIYLLIGALNPAAEVVRDERGWWVEAVQPALAAWLPTSVQSDYQSMNAWRVLASFSASFALIWGLWAGLTRRKPVLLVLWSLLLSGAGMGLVAILQHLTEAKDVLWTFPSSNPQFWGSFFYRNQGAAYLNLVLVAAAFLFFYHAIKSRQRLRHGGPHFLCFFLFFITATSIGLALSRGGILFGLILTVVFFGLLIIYGIQSLFHVRSVIMTALTVLCLAAGIYTVVTYVDLDAIETRFGDVEATIETANQDARAFSTRATWDMAQDRLAFGWGAGSFRHIFPMYQRNYPELYYRTYHKKKQQWVGRKVYRYAHNDIVQFVAEYGVVGSLLVFGAIGVLLLQALYHSGGQVFACLILLAGTSQAFGHAFLDFIFNSPAYWMAFLGLLATATKLLSLERARGA